MMLMAGVFLLSPVPARDVTILILPREKEVNIDYHIIPTNLPYHARVNIKLTQLIFGVMGLARR